MKSLKIRKRDLRLFGGCLLLCLGLFRICIFTNTQFKAYSFAILACLAAKTGLKKSRIKRNAWPIILGAVVALSTLFQSFAPKYIFKACTYFLQFVTPFLLLDYLTERYGYGAMLKGVMYASLFFCTLMDISVLTGIGAQKTRYQNLVTYFLGNKFMVSYLHMQTLGLIAQHLNLHGKLEKGWNRLGLTLYGLLGIAFCGYVKCATGMIGNFVILFLILFPFGDRMKRILARPSVMLMSLLVMSVLIIGSGALLNLPAVQYVIVNILKKDLTLTGRFYIYQMLPDVYSGHWIIGYGYGSDIFAELIGYGNAQHGILQYVLDCGLLGAGALLMTWVASVRKAGQKEILCWPLICVVYGFVVCSVVEVCLNINFMLILSIISSIFFVSNKERNE